MSENYVVVVGINTTDESTTWDALAAYETSVQESHAFEAAVQAAAAYRAAQEARPAFKLPKFPMTDSSLDEWEARLAAMEPIPPIALPPSSHLHGIAIHADGRLLSHRAKTLTELRSIFIDRNQAPRSISYRFWSDGSHPAEADVEQVRQRFAVEAAADLDPVSQRFRIEVTVKASTRQLVESTSRSIADSMQSRGFAVSVGPTTYITLEDINARAENASRQLEALISEQKGSRTETTTPAPAPAPAPAPDKGTKSHLWNWVGGIVGAIIAGVVIAWIGSLFGWGG